MQIAPVILILFEKHSSANTHCRFQIELEFVWLRIQNTEKRARKTKTSTVTPSFYCSYSIVVYMAVSCAKFEKKCWQYMLRCYSVMGITLLKMHSMEFVFSLHLNFLFLLLMIKARKKKYIFNLTREISSQYTVDSWKSKKRNNRLFRLTCSKTYEGGLLFKITAKKITFFNVLWSYFLFFP